MHSLLSDLGFSGAGVDSLLEGRFYIYLPRPPTHFFDLPPWCPPQSFVRDGHFIWGINYWTISDEEAVLGFPFPLGLCELLSLLALLNYY